MFWVCVMELLLQQKLYCRQIVGGSFLVLTTDETVCSHLMAVLKFTSEASQMFSQASKFWHFLKVNTQK